MHTFRVARLRPHAFLPTRKHPEDAGVDFYAAEETNVPAHGFAIVATGVTVDIPAGFVGLLKPKGRSNHLLGAGVVDAGYQGEILIKVANPTAHPLVFLPGDPVGQMILLPVVTPQVEEVLVDEIHVDRSMRGGGGGIVEQFKPE